MPSEKIDYSNTIIYKIVCKDLEVRDCYVGHTTNFTKRKSKHKRDCTKESSNNHNLQVYKFIRDNGGWDNWDMVLIEQCECKDGLDAAARERYWYEQLNATLNKNVPNRGQQEYKKTYYAANREQEIERVKAYKAANREQLLEYQKTYYAANREQQIERVKAYYATNQEQIKAKRSVPVECQCGGKYTLWHKAHHLKTRKHQMWQCQSSNNLST